jgi:hypothetical protein
MALAARAQRQFRCDARVGYRGRTIRGGIGVAELIDFRKVLRNKAAAKSHQPAVSGYRYRLRLCKPIDEYDGQGIVHLEHEAEQRLCHYGGERLRKLKY